MPNINNDNKPASSKGFYFVLAICLVGAATSAWIATGKLTNETNDLPNSSQTERIEISVLEPAGKNKSDVKIKESKPQTSTSKGSSQSPKTSKSNPAQPQVIKSIFTMPVEGEIFGGFSHGELVKDETMGDWRTHNGVDIKAEEGAVVKSIGAGTVKKVRTDPLWGCVVEVDHGNKIIAFYCGLASEVSVKEGDMVDSLTILGKVAFIPVEGKLPTHLHLEIKQDGKYVDFLTLTGVR